MRMSRSMVEATTLPLMWSWRYPASLSVTATDAFTPSSM